MDAMDHRVDRGIGVGDRDVDLRRLHHSAHDCRKSAARHDIAVAVARSRRLWFCRLHLFLARRRYPVEALTRDTTRRGVARLRDPLYRTDDFVRRTVHGCGFVDTAERDRRFLKRI